ncbi:MAG TPA: CYTH domain-containing protein [Euzebyales bacterium]
MSYEIERKFLLDALPEITAAAEPTHIDQGYLAVTDDLEVRVRARGGDHLLTVKGGRGEVRREVTIELSEEQFDQLWELTDGRRIRKQRWVLPTDDGVEIEVDRFADHLDGLLIAEVEFASEDDGRAFTPPDWFGREITDDDRYRNAALATDDPRR